MDVSGVKRVYASHFGVAALRPLVTYALVRSLRGAHSALNCLHLRILRRRTESVKQCDNALYLCGELNAVAFVNCNAMRCVIE